MDMGTEAIEDTVVSVLQGQLADTQKQVEFYKQRTRDVTQELGLACASVHQLTAEIEEMQRAVGEDIQLFYNKAKSVIESQFGLGLKMRPADLIKLWLMFYHMARQFTGAPADQRLMDQMDQTAQGMAQQMVERGDIHLERNQVRDMLERVVYPYITITTGEETLTWTEMRAKYR